MVLITGYAMFLMTYLYVACCFFIIHTNKDFLLLVMYRCSPYVVLHGSMDVIIAVMKQKKLRF